MKSAGRALATYIGIIIVWIASAFLVGGTGNSGAMLWALLMYALVIGGWWALGALIAALWLFGVFGND